MSTFSPSNQGKKTIPQILQKKDKQEKISVLTAYDYPFAMLLDSCDVDILLVGDSLAEVCLGYSSTIPITMEEMIHHAKAVVRGTKQALVVVDMPFLSFQISPEETLKNAGRILKETGCDAVKIEGGTYLADTIHRLVQAGIPVMGHIGLQPQSIKKIGKYQVQGKNEGMQELLKEQALSLQEAGVFSMVLELVVHPLALEISKSLAIPTIGIGSGDGCDGQVLVIHDMLGMDPEKRFKHCRVYSEVGKAIQQAVSSYISDVKSGRFPSDAESFH